MPRAPRRSHPLYRTYENGRELLSYSYGPMGTCATSTRRSTKGDYARTVATDGKRNAREMSCKTKNTRKTFNECPYLANDAIGRHGCADARYHLPTTPGRARCFRGAESVQRRAGARAAQGPVRDRSLSPVDARRSESGGGGGTDRKLGLFPPAESGRRVCAQFRATRLPSR
jgi:hypothetical protein